MPPERDLQFPFLTRKMLAFDPNVTFRLRLMSQSIVAGTIRVSGITKEGPFTFDFQSAGSSARAFDFFALPDMPIFVTVRAATGVVDEGQCYVSLSLDLNEVLSLALLSGHLSPDNHLSWPMTNLASQRPFEGNLLAITSANPAAGAELTQTVTAGQMWKLRAIRFQLVTAATVGSRRVHVVITHAGGGIVDLFSITDQIISQTRNYTVAPFGGLLTDANDNDILISMPAGMKLDQGSTITTETLNLAAGDDFGAMIIETNQFFRPS